MNILLLGSSGHAKVVIDIIEKENIFKIAGIIDPTLQPNIQIMGYPILGKESDIPNIIKKNNISGFLVAIGDNCLREKVVTNVKEICPTLPFVSTIHPSANIGKNVTIGCGTVIMAGTVINPDSNVGEFCIINTNASLDHDCSLGNFSSLAPRVVTGGNCIIGDRCAIGIGAVLTHGISIGKDTVIGAGSLVMENFGDCIVAYGSPAKKIRDRKFGDKYL